MLLTYKAGLFSEGLIFIK